MIRTVSSLVVVLILSASGAAAQSALDDDLYAAVPGIGGFLQQVHHEGKPATEATEAWILFDDTNGSQNDNWNTVWDVKTTRFDQGVNIRRIVRWKNEVSFVTPVPPSYGTGGVAQMGGVGDHRSFDYSGWAGFSAHVAMEPTVTVNWVALPHGRFTARLQFNPGVHTLSSSARRRWDYIPGSELFVVYSDGRDTLTDRFPLLQNRSFAVKLTRLLRF